MIPAIAAAVLLLASASRAADVGPELQVAPPIVREASGAQTNPVIASAGGDSLVAWIDGTRLGVFVTTVAADGTVAAPARRIFRGSAGQVALCWTGASYLATWYDAGNGIRAISLNRDGTPAGESRLIIPNGFSGALSWNGDRALLAYIDFSTSHSGAALLDAQGNVVRAAIPIADSSDVRRIGVAGRTFFVFQRVRSGSAPPAESVVMQRIDGNGALLDAAPRIVATPGLTGYSFGVASDGKRLAVVVAASGNPTSSLRRYLIDADTLTTTSLPIVTANAIEGANVAFDGRAFVALWNEYPVDPAASIASSQLRSLPFDDGADAAPSVIAAGFTYEPVAVSNGANLVVVWSSNGATEDVDGEILDATATRAVSPLFTCSTAPAEQFSPVSAPGLVAWLEPMSDSVDDVFAAHTDGAGGFGARVRVSSSSAAIQTLAAIFVGSTYFLAWDEGGTIMLRRLRDDGTPLDAAPVAVGGGRNPALAFDGKTILLAYIDGLVGVKGLRFDRDGVRVDASPIAIAHYDALVNPGGPTVRSLSAASNGAGFLVAWLTEVVNPPSDPPPGVPPSPPTTHDLYAALVTADGAVFDIGEIATGGYPGRPSAASSGSDYLIAFSSTFPGTPRILAVRVLPNGTATAPIEIARTDVVLSDPAAGSDPTGYWIAWSSGDLLLTHLGATLEIAQSIAHNATQPSLGGGAIVYARTDDADEQLVFARALPARTRGRAARH